MRLLSLCAAFTFVASCGGGGDNKDGGLPDALSDGLRDGGSTALAIGAACKKSSDCGTGMTCLTGSTLPGATNGYCSRSCVTSPDVCDSSSTCLPFDSAGQTAWCVATCAKIGSDCRESDHYACWVLTFNDGTVADVGACLPTADSSGQILCDPTAADPTCDFGEGLQTPCLRYRWGTGEAGICLQDFLACSALGTGTCPTIPASDGVPAIPQSCFVIPELWPDSSVFPNDTFFGPICLPTLPGAPGADAECLYDDGQGGKQHFLDACVDGYECNLADDNRCRALCYPDGPPTGVAIPDGGAIAATCDSECRKVFGDNVNFGLCIPPDAGTPPDAGLDQAPPIDAGTPD